MTTNLTTLVSDAQQQEGQEYQVLVEDGDTAQLCALPFLLVFPEIGLHGLQEGPDKGHLECRANNAMFAPLVATCTKLSVAGDSVSRGIEAYIDRR